MYFQKQLEECMKNSGPEIAKLRTELTYFKSENRDFFGKLSKIEVLYYELTKKYDEMEDKLIQTKINYENCEALLKTT